MLEHAVQERLLGVYEEVAGRLQSQEDARAAGLLHQAAALVRKFYEDFHQRLEEQYVFPHFENHAQLGPLVKTLKAQHAALRAMTDKILEATGNRPPAAGALPAEGARSELAQACRKTVRLCRPHMAREATDLFQALYDAVPAATLNQLSEVFEKKQEEVFGDDPLQNILAEVAGIEKELGLLDLSRLTP
jgi:hemerythrin-like domain-containing protein